MDREDVARFRCNLEKHLRGDFNAEERHQMKTREIRAKSNVNKLISNSGGRNPILGY